MHRDEMDTGVLREEVGRASAKGLRQEHHQPQGGNCNPND